jgi:hypothetical protein
MSSPNMAKRTHGICQGSLWRHTDSSSKTFSSSSSYKVYDYCVLVGVRLSSYENMQDFKKGAHPVVTFCIVGASPAAASSKSKDTSSFRLVTNQGTHVYCTAPTSSCRDVWLGALNAGLERRLSSSNSLIDAPVLPMVKSKFVRKKVAERFCRSCGKMERLEFPLKIKAAPLSQYGMEERVDLCPKCLTAQGVLDHVQFVREVWSSAAQEREALLQARKLCWMKLRKRSTTETTAAAPAADDENSLHYQQHVNGWVPMPTSSYLLKEILKSQPFQACQRVSPTLDSLCLQYNQGIMGVLEFLEQLDHAVGHRDDSMSDLKKQAFRVAGDMGTAMKLLMEHALPNTNSAAAVARGGNTDMLQCILEFFLDMAEEGELSSLAFFWPQLCYIHLRMLPPENSQDLARVELYEDFLLTVSAKYSIQMSLELIWSHSADLEDSMTAVGASNSTAVETSPPKRRFAVIRFLCELESLLFDSENCWGGGSVTVGHLLSPSKHQVGLLGDALYEVQDFRKQQVSTDRLSRSARMDKLTKSKNINDMDTSLEILAQEALRIAMNADYLSSHLVFTKRLCDIAEKLRFMDVKERAQALESELAKLNSSGSMGGDPLNKVREHLCRVVRVPPKEGHVFRSKERTPVLLLLEVVDEGAQAEFDQQAEDQRCQDEKKVKDEGNNEAELANKALGADTREAGSGQDEDGDKKEKEAPENGEVTKEKVAENGDATDAAAAESGDEGKKVDPSNQLETAETEGSEGLPLNSSHQSLEFLSAHESDTAEIDDECGTPKGITKKLVHLNLEGSFAESEETKTRK